jgi:methanethiol S-methyltransferase
MRKVLVFLYGLLSYLLFIGLFLYLIGFLADFLVPKTVNRGGNAPMPLAVLVDVGLILLFGLQHSLMARPKFKAWLMKRIPKEAERSTYVLVSSLALGLLLALWQPIPWVIWEIQIVYGQVLMYSLFGLGIVGILATSVQINHFDLFGLRQVTLYLLGRDYHRPKLVKSFLYKWVRNPMHTATMIFFLATPRLTAGHLLLGLGMVMYALVGIHYEERDLERVLGEPFRAYRRSTPSLLPIPFRNWQRQESQSVSPPGEGA